MQMKKMFAVMMIALLAFMTVGTGQVAEAGGNQEAKGKLTVHKYEREPGAEDGADGDGSAGQTAPEDAVALEGVTYKITQTHAYNPKTDKWTEFTGENTRTRVTGTDGEAVFGKLSLGRYEVKETAGPAHVNLNPDIFTVDIPMTSADGTNINYDVHIYPKNEIIRGAVKLKKSDGENGFAGLAGAVFNLYHEDGTLVENGADLTTNAQGYIYVDGLAYGDYYFTEVAPPDGYVLQGDQYTFSISKSGTITQDGEGTGEVEKVTVKNYYEPEIEKTINGGDTNLPINRDTEFDYNLKITLPSDIQDYSRFVVTDVLDPNLAYGGDWTVNGVDASALEFAVDGQTLTWTVDDFAALAGKKSITINFKAKVKAGAPADEEISNTGTVDYKNKSGTEGHIESDPVIVVPTVGSLNVKKVDENGDDLSGAEFELRNVNGDVVGTGTGSGATFTWSELDYGEYTLHETKAPDGYRKLNKPINVTINAEKSHVTLTVENSESGWELPKTGGIGTTLFSGIGILLMGAAIMIYARRKKSVTQ